MRKSVLTVAGVGIIANVGGGVSSEYSEQEEFRENRAELIVKMESRSLSPEECGKLITMRKTGGTLLSPNPNEIEGIDDWFCDGLSYAHPDIESLNNRKAILYARALGPKRTGRRAWANNLQEVTELGAYLNMEKNGVMIVENANSETFILKLIPNVE